MLQNRQVLPIIVLSQFLCTTLWFGGNAVLPDLMQQLRLPVSALANITSAVQFGFITGTLLYALGTVADLMKPSLVFFISAVAAALANICIIRVHDFNLVLVLRFCTGFFLAGIYPVGMKIAADHYNSSLGKALGFLVGALVLGTAFPHLLKSLSISLPWSIVLIAVSIMAVTGGILMLLFVPPGVYRKPMQRPDLRLILKVFRPKEFRSAAFGYFGHMWELYTFWAFLPLIIRTWMELHHAALPISFTAFIVIGIGSMACVWSGYISQKWGSRKTAVIALSGSFCCCLLSPLMFYLPSTGFIIFLLIWGWLVIADSPMFSTLVAQQAGVQQKGTALTITTCIGFSITIVSLETLNYFSGIIKNNTMLLLAPGPLLGLIALRKKDPGAARL